MLRFILFYLLILPKFVIWPLFFLYRFYLKKKGIENDFVTRQLNYLRCLWASRFKGQDPLQQNPGAPGEGKEESPVQ